MTHERRLTICSRTEVSSQLSGKAEVFRISGNPAPEGRPSFAQPFSVCVRTGFWAIRWNEELENAAPEGRTNLAQRFSAGKSGKNELSPGGTTQFSRIRFSAGNSGKNDLSPGGTTQFSRTL